MDRVTGGKSMMVFALSARKACPLFAAIALSLQPWAARADCEMTDVLDLPVKLDGLWAGVDVKIEGRPARLVVDSGSSGNFLSATAANKLGLDVEPDPKWVAEGSNGEFRESVTSAKTFEMAGFRMKGVRFMVGPTELAGGVEGLLGQDVLGATDIDFDYAAGFIRFIKPKDCGGQPLAYWAKPGQAYGMVEIRSSDPDLKDLTGVAEVNGVKVRVLFDTGGADSTLSLGAARRAGITPQDPGAVAAGDLGGLGRRGVSTWIAPVKSFEIGGEQILNTKLRIADWTGADRKYAEMILGGDFFISHHVYLSNSQHRIYFTYNGGPVFDLTSGAPRSASK